MASTVVIEILEDGTLKINARDMIGTEAELLSELSALAKEVGGELKVEKHVPGHTHSHSHSHDHHHKHKS